MRGLARGTQGGRGLYREGSEPCVSCPGPSTDSGLEVRVLRGRGQWWRRRCRWDSRRGTSRVGWTFSLGPKATPPGEGSFHRPRIETPIGKKVPPTTRDGVEERDSFSETPPPTTRVRHCESSIVGEDSLNGGESTRGVPLTPSPCPKPRRTPRKNPETGCGRR